MLCLPADLTSHAISTFQRLTLQGLKMGGNANARVAQERREGREG